MKRLLVVALMLVGALLVASGAAVGLVVGPHDTVFSRATTIEGGLPVVTEPDLLSFENLELHVRADNGERVFIGAANPVDVTDYTADAARFSVDRLSPTGPAGSEADGAALPIDPMSADFWSDRVIGTDEQTLTLQVDGDPVQVMIAPLGPDPAPVEVRFGTTIDGLFWWAMGVLGGGLLLLLVAAGGHWLGRRRRRVAAQREPQSAEPATALRSRLVVPVAALGLLLSGCSALPRELPYDGASKILTDQDMEAAWRDLRLRWRYVLQEVRAPAYRHEAWQEITTGPELEGNVFDTRLNKLLGDRKNEPLEPTFEPVFVYATPQESYPMWVIASYGLDGESRDSGVAVLRRDSAAGSWKLHSGVGASPPRPIETPPAAATGQTIRAGERIIDELRDYWESGKKPTSVELTYKDEQVYRELAKERRREDHLDRVERTTRVAYPNHPMTVAPVVGGTLYVADIEFTETLTGSGGIRWKKGYDELNETLSPYQLRRRSIVTVAVLAYDGGSTSIIGFNRYPMVSDADDDARPTRARGSGQVVSRPAVSLRPAP